jgi:FlaG/FlaF family flagellin (archaellin)
MAGLTVEACSNFLYTKIQVQDAKCALALYTEKNEEINKRLQTSSKGPYTLFMGLINIDSEIKIEQEERMQT